MDIKILGIDLAKNCFHLYGTDERGAKLVCKKLSRGQFVSFLSQLKPCVVGFEACGSAHFWAKHLKTLGHEVRMVSPQYVKPFVKTQKNDANDAKAIVEAICRPSMHFVAPKEDWQLEILALHRIRSRLVKNRIALTNQIRGLLYEFGITIPKGPSYLQPELLYILEQNNIRPLIKGLLADLQSELKSTLEQTRALEEKIKLYSRENESCKRIQEIPGIGPITSTALVASIGDPKQFRNGRQLSAWLGLVPRQNSTGGKTRLMSITKRGDDYLRTLLIVGSRAVLRHLGRDKHKSLARFNHLQLTKHSSIAAVALANRNARVAWAMLNTGSHYMAA